MLTNAFKLIKHNFLKYFFLGILIFILILAGLILRISYKPLDINFITKYVKKEK